MRSCSQDGRTAAAPGCTAAALLGSLHLSALLHVSNVSMYPHYPDPRLVQVIRVARRRTGPHAPSRIRTKPYTKASQQVNALHLNPYTPLRTHTRLYTSTTFAAKLLRQARGGRPRRRGARGFLAGHVTALGARSPRGSRGGDGRVHCATQPSPRPPLRARAASARRGAGTASDIATPTRVATLRAPWEVSPKGRVGARRPRKCGRVGQTQWLKYSLAAPRGVAG